MVQSHVHLLACCPHWINSHYYLLARPSTIPQEPEMVRIFEREFQPGPSIRGHR